MKIKDDSWKRVTNRIREVGKTTRSEIRLCGECGNRYLAMEKHRGECYLCPKIACNSTHRRYIPAEIRS